MRIAIISDTHGLVRPEVAQTCDDCDHILHAGDVGSDEALIMLERFAQITVVRGNVDHGGRIGRLPETAAIELDGWTFYLLHIRGVLTDYPPPAGTSFVLFGHSHAPLLERKDGTVYLNPGSCGRRRFNLPVHWCIFDTETRMLEKRFIDDNRVQSCTWLQL